MESNVILTDRDVDHVLGAVLPNVSIGLREAVSNVYAAVQRIAPIDQRENNESMDRNFAIFAKGYYRMLRILTNMSDAFELSEAAKPHFANDSIAGICQGICASVTDLFDMAGRELCFKSEGSASLIACDRWLIERMLLELLSNALKFTPKGGQGFRVRSASCGLYDDFGVGYGARHSAGYGRYDFRAILTNR